MAENSENTQVSSLNSDVLANKIIDPRPRDNMIVQRGSFVSSNHASSMMSESGAVVFQGML